MDDGDQPEDVCERAGTEGTLAEEVPDMAVYQARYHRAVQADRFRHGMVFHLSAVLHGDVYHRVRSHSRNPHG